ncbi:MAG: hypothetical protein QF918_03840 [Pirellulaceae bacterium]|nr:hypothetical protein [Pirellulaceae bacterium]MDP6721306.1 hypothetical protein [Pirellulaceae bacterium]
MKCHIFSLATMFVLALAQATAYAQTRDEKVRTDRDEIAEGGLWIYNNLPRGFSEAKQTGKPLLIVFR